MRLLTLVVVASSLRALAWGPVVEGGVMAVTTPGALTARPFGGFTASAGLEFGERLNHEVALELVSLTGTEAASAQGLGARYTLSFDFFGKQGFSPTVGLGVGVGRFIASSPGDRVAGFFVSGRALAGIRYTFDIGLSLKALLVGNVYGPQISLVPTLGLGWQL